MRQDRAGQSRDRRTRQQVGIEHRAVTFSSKLPCSNASNRHAHVHVHIHYCYLRPHALPSRTSFPYLPSTPPPSLLNDPLDALAQGMKRQQQRRRRNRRRALEDDTTTNQVQTPSRTDQ